MVDHAPTLLLANACKKKLKFSKRVVIHSKRVAKYSNKTVYILKTISSYYCNSNIVLCLQYSLKFSWEVPDLHE